MINKLDMKTKRCSVIGKLLGYPNCCIKEFCIDPPILKLENKNHFKRIEASRIKGESTGFIPCIYHAKKIIAKKIIIEALIKNRNKKIPQFPLFNF